MPPDKKQIAADCFKKGTEAMAKENWDYAVDMFDKAVTLVPDNVFYRKTLRGCEGRKYGNNGSGARMAGMKVMKIRGRIKKAKMQKDWRAVDRAAEDGLKINPWDASFNAEMAQACEELGFGEVAVFGYEKALEKDPDNKNTLRTFALLLEERSSYEDAAKRWERILKMVPLDGEAREKITHLEAKAVMDRGGYEDAKSIQDVKEEQDEEIQSAYDLDRPTKKVLSEAADGPGVSVEADLQRLIRKEPTNEEPYIKLAQYYKAQKKLAKSAEMYRKAVELSGDDPNIRELLEDVEMLQFKHKIESAKQAAAKNPKNEKFAKRLAELKKELARREIDVLTARVEHYPKDASLKYQLARRYMMFKEWTQAIPLLQQCTADQRFEIEVGVALGECFIADKKKKLAQRQFERVVGKIDVHEKVDLFKKSHYYLGTLLEEAGQRDAAEQHYQEILGVDYEYKDVLQRLEKLESDDESVAG